MEACGCFRKEVLRLFSVRHFNQDSLCSHRLWAVLGPAAFMVMDWPSPLLGPPNHQGLLTDCVPSVAWGMTLLHLLGERQVN